MARDHYPPAFSKDEEILKYLKGLENDIKVLKNRTTSTLQQTDVSDIDDPIEGEHVIDYSDDQHKWYSHGAWRSGGGFTPQIAGAVTQAPFTAGIGNNFRPISNLYTTNAGMFGYASINFGLGALDCLAINQPGHYLMSATGTLVVQPTTLTGNLHWSLHLRYQPGTVNFGEMTFKRDRDPIKLTQWVASYVMRIDAPVYAFPNVVSEASIGISNFAFSVTSLSDSLGTTVHP